MEGFIFDVVGLFQYRRCRCNNVGELLGSRSSHCDVEVQGMLVLLVLLMLSLLRLLAC